LNDFFINFLKISSRDIKPPAQKVKITGCYRNHPNPIGAFFAFSAGIAFAIFALNGI